MSTCVCVAEPSQFSGREAELYTVAIVVYSGRRTPTFYEATVSKHGGEGTSRFPRQTLLARIISPGAVLKQPLRLATQRRFLTRKAAKDTLC